MVALERNPSSIHSFLSILNLDEGTNVQILGAGSATSAAEGLPPVPGSCVRYDRNSGAHSFEFEFINEQLACLLSKFRRLRAQVSENFQKVARPSMRTTVLHFVVNPNSSMG